MADAYMQSSATSLYTHIVTSTEDFAILGHESCSNLEKVYDQLHDLAADTVVREKRRTGTPPSLAPALASSSAA
jgi:hypothetical protein